MTVIISQTLRYSQEQDIPGQDILKTLKTLKTPKTRLRHLCLTVLVSQVWKYSINPQLCNCKLANLEKLRKSLNLKHFVFSLRSVTLIISFCYRSINVKLPSHPNLCRPAIFLNTLRLYKKHIQGERCNLQD